MDSNREQDIIKTWRAEQKVKRAAKITDRLIELKALGNPTIDGKEWKLNAYCTPDCGVEDTLLGLINPRAMPDTRDGDYPDRWYLDVTLEADGVFYSIDLGIHHPTREVGYRYEAVGKAVLYSVHTIGSGKDKRVIAAFDVAATDDDMRPLNHL